MAKAGRGADQYMLRFPEGLRDRIKAYAERTGTSMNSEIVRVLEREFPEQWPVDSRFGELIEMVDLLRASKTDTRINEFIEKFDETVVGIVSGRVTGVDAETREAIAGAWHEYQTREAEDQVHAFQAEYDEEETASMELIGRPEKYAIPPAVKKKLGNLTEEEFEIYRLGYEAGAAHQHESPPSDGDDPFIEE
ncbi:Arc family DNA-binding protein [Rhizobium gallicum]|uniref:Arc family DNA-binding protein n=1 Tax=Rhizobium gallicum TaxID=56730 RepID=UPI000A76C91A|nr:Arc family DNA-binding protein [Rhizobium gallicum]